MVEVVVPWRAGCPHRESALEWVRRRYLRPVTVAAGPDPWSKATAVMPAVRASTAGVIVVADADVWCDGWLAAVRTVQNGAPWAIPHREVHRLTESATAAVLAGADWRRQPLAERAYKGVEGGGMIVARRDVLLDCPLDPRFVGWGQEDESWALALRCLHGPPWRGTAPLVHLWHPPAPRMTRRRGTRESWRLHGRYRAAARRPKHMRALVREPWE